MPCFKARSAVDDVALSRRAWQVCPLLSKILASFVGNRQIRAPTPTSPRINVQRPHLWLRENGSKLPFGVRSLVLSSFCVKFGQLLSK